MPGSKAWNHDVSAQEWFYGLMTRPDVSIKSERKADLDIEDFWYFVYTETGSFLRIEEKLKIWRIED